MACIVTGCIATACTTMACIVVACIVTAHIVVAYVAMGLCLQCLELVLLGGGVRERALAQGVTETLGHGPQLPPRTAHHAAEARTTVAAEA